LIQHKDIMGHIKTLNKWANAHTYYPLDLLRIALGILLFYQGVYFMSNLSLLTDLYKPLEVITDNVLLVHYIAPAHFVGGFLIVFGLLTRWAVIAQLPILIGAVSINFIGEMNTSNFLLSSIVLLACIFFLFYGSGKHSVDKYLKMQQ
jgi:putative oxidoreductase